ncbi:unnamed protein product [Moneuplotes crassus]|uniref:Selenoprotein W n=1 Tax=Euplotes crassus TaxID=5936 RepID=A0AAD2D705_EUPCR|nr:unnamed protein product [Moneuplotes crassus]
MGVCGSKAEIFGSKDAEFTMKIQFCGGCSYRPKAVYVQKEVEKIFGEKLAVIFKKDLKVTGNFEITLFNQKTGESKLVHSKKNGGGFVKEDNFDEFKEKLAEFCSS